MNITMNPRLDKPMVPLIKLTDVNMRFDNRTILDDVNLTVNKGDFIAITGPNGGGKTTLLRIILRLLTPTSGSVFYLPEPSQSLTSTLKIGYLPQKNSIDSRFPITVREVIASGLLGNGRITKKEIAQLVDATLDAMDLHEHASKSIGNLSGGQLQRTLMGRAIISSPTVLVLDEPLSYIDKRFETRFINLLHSLAASTTILLVSHEMTSIAPLVSRHLIVDHTLHECTAHHTFTPSPCN